MRLLIDGIAFDKNDRNLQYQWHKFLQKWSKHAFYGHVVFVLDRKGKVPKIPGFRYIFCPDNLADELDNKSIDNLRIRVGADHFISSLHMPHIINQLGPRSTQANRVR